MSAKLEALARRRAELVAKSAQQRQQLAYHFSQCERPMRLIDTGLRLYRTVRAHPMIIAGVAAVVGKVFAGRLGFVQRIGTWYSRAMTAWQVFSRVRASFAQFTQPRQG